MKRNIKMESLTAQMFYLVLVLLSFLSLVLSSSGESSQAKLEVHNTFKPETCHRKSKPTDLITLHYKGTLQNGQMFDSSYERNEPLTFQIGIGQVIQGWDEGLLGVCAGEKLKLVIPPHLGYGDAKHDQIPPGSTLTFELEIVKVEDGPKPANVFKQIDTDADRRLSRKEIGDFLKRQSAGARAHGDLGTSEDPEMLQMVEQIFQHEDKDKDEYITFEEFSGPKTDHDEL